LGHSGGARPPVDGTLSLTSWLLPLLTSQPR